MIKNAIWLFVITLFVLFLFLPSYTKLQDLKQRNIDYERQVQILKERKIKLTEEKRLLEQDPVYLEKVAREKMGLIRKGEVIYKITPATNAETPKPDQL
jgi:cell division protein FtsB